MSLLPPSPSSSHPIATNGNSVSVPNTSGSFGSNAVPPALLGPSQTGFDIWGPLQRRKYLIALFCLIGAGLGFLFYSKTPKTYSSATQLMITTHAPPSLVDGDVRMDQVSLSKHSSLVSSELVLANASRDGKFETMKSFDETSYPVGQLKQMITVVPGEKETLTIVCSGPDPDELPVILNQIVVAYEEIILEDSEDIGAETLALVKQLANSLADEKTGAERRRLELWNQLEIKSVDNNGNVINPFNKRLLDLTEQQSELQSQLRETQQRAKLLVASLQLDKETGVIDPIHVKVAAIEAQEYLKLDRATFKEEEMGSDRIVRSLQNERQERATLEGRVWALETKITDLRFQRAKLSNVFGSGHKSIDALDQQIEFYSGEATKIEVEVEKLSKTIEEQSLLDAAKPEEKVDRIDLATFRAREDREWITMYQLALERQQEKLVSSLRNVDVDYEKVSAAAEQVASGIAELNLLQKQIDEKGREINAILDRLSQMTILANNYTMTKVRTLDYPKRGSQIAPSLAKSLALGTVLAFLLGLGLAILVDQSELAFRNPHEIFDRLQVPVVGRIPRINTRKIQAAHGHPSLIAAHKPGATASESFRDVRTGLFFRSNLEDLKTILFTSPSPGDGKSTTVANMAISIAQAGKRVILVDADFRRPRVHQYFGEEMNPGMLDVLSGDQRLKDAIQKSKLQDNLYLLTTGGRPRNPGELVTSEAFRDLIEALRKKFDYVLIDSPPVLPVSDPATIASMVDGVYLVTRIRKGVKLTAHKAKETLDRVGAHWLGVVVNGIDENPHYSEYGYQYGNYAYSYYGGMYGRYYDANNQAYRDKIVEKTQA